MQIFIGLETHVQLKTKTKLFCACKQEFAAPPNTNVCPICLGLPGVLPTVNQEAVRLAIIAAVATNCKISKICRFYRKNYFYPDLPKAYQISQYDEPIATDGYIEIVKEDKKIKKIRIERISLEEDAGKLLHQDDINKTLIDFNRCGVPLIEIVSAPDLESPQEAYLYLSYLKTLLRYCEVSDCDMEKGFLRCDANISIKINNLSSAKVEIKNLNSFKAVKQALEYEIVRQQEELRYGGSKELQTRLWDEQAKKTVLMREKEEAADYRYFPEPDLLPIIIDPSYVEENIKKKLPELPRAKKERFEKEYGLSSYDAEVLTQDKQVANFFEEVNKIYNKEKNKDKAKKVSNWIMTNVLFLLKEEKVKKDELRASSLAELLTLIDEDKITTKIGKEILTEVLTSGISPKELIEKKGYLQITDSAWLRRVIEEVLKENPKAVAEYKEGKIAAINFLVGKTMQKTKGKADPVKVKEEIKKII